MWHSSHHMPHTISTDIANHPENFTSGATIKWLKGWLVASPLLACALFLSGASRASAQQEGDGPTHVLATYTCKPGDRGALRAHLETVGVAHFEDLKSRGIIRDYLILFSSFVNRDAWDLLTVVSFEKYTKTAAWETFAKEQAGGLPAATLSWVQPVNEYVADLTWAGAPDKKTSTEQTIYVVQTKEFENWANRPLYHQYMQAHELVLLNQLVKTGAVGAYSIFENQHYNGEAWDVMHILEYPDTLHFLQRTEAHKAGVASLANNPGYKVFETNRQQYILPGRAVIAEAIRTPSTASQ
jgi:hypothetical protein